MAKSLRSKWKKQMRAIKRIRYGQKELERLKSVLANDVLVSKSGDLEMNNLSEITTVVDPKTATVGQQSPTDEGYIEVMEVDTKRKYNRRTMKDEHGNYPPWLSKKKMRQVSLQNKKMKLAQRTGKKKTSGKRRHR